jgi:DNA-binding beta-propeller fold protein YncE
MISLYHFSIETSYNLPKFCSAASWHKNAITFAGSNETDYNANGLFVGKNNTVYIADKTSNTILVWFNESSTITRNISGGLQNPNTLFVTLNGDIYVDNEESLQVEKWSVDSTNGTPVMAIIGSCYGLFVDPDQTLYCSMKNYHQVIKQTLADGSNTSAIAAGNGTSGASSDMLDSPHGIFVDIHFNLYVADYFNHRIQRFKYGELNGTTVVSNASSVYPPLFLPIHVILDADSKLYIVENGRHRILISDFNGIRCLVGCSGKEGSGPNELSQPCFIAFDSFRNFFIIDQGNNRTQKFTLASDPCGKFSNNYPINT